MKKTLFLLLVLISSNSFASEAFFSNQSCIDTYRTGYTQLQEAVRKFNDGFDNRFEFSAKVSANSTTIGVIRGACLMVENPTVEDCVTAYKDIYGDLRSQIKLSAILMGNQERVTYSEEMQKVVESETRTRESQSLLSKLKRSLNLGVGVITETFERVKDITMLEFVDAKCGN